MRCRNVQQWLVSHEKKDEKSPDFFRIQNHLNECDPCFHFKQDLNDIREIMAGNPRPEPPPELVRSTFNRCRNMLNTPSPAPVPKTIWVTFTLILIMTIWLTLPAPALLQNKSPQLSYLDITPLMLIIQNAVMLLFFPVILIKLNRRKTCYSQT